jgi:hypothetical protein
MGSDLAQTLLGWSCLLARLRSWNDEPFEDFVRNWARRFDSFRRIDRARANSVAAALEGNGEKGEVLLPGRTVASSLFGPRGVIGQTRRSPATIRPS